MESSKRRVKEDKPKPRNSTYKNRKLGLKKKLHELTTLCDVDGAIIFFEPNQNKPEICSRNPEVANKVINKYIGLTAEQKAKGSLSLFDVFGGKKKGLEKADSGKLRNKNYSAEYSTWDPVFDTMSDDQVRKVLSLLDAPIEAVKRKLEEKRLALVDYSQVPPDQVDLSVKPLNSYQPSDVPQDQQNQWHQTMMNNDFTMRGMNNSNMMNNVAYGLPNQSMAFNQIPMTTWMDDVDYASSSGLPMINSQFTVMTEMNDFDYSAWDIPTVNNQFPMVNNDFGPYDLPLPMMVGSDSTYLTGGSIPSPPSDDSWLSDIFPDTAMNGYDCGRLDQGSLWEMFTTKPVNSSPADHQLVY